MDVFIIMCFGIVFAALIEFACINFIDTLIRRIKKKEKERMRLKVIINYSIAIQLILTYKIVIREKRTKGNLTIFILL